LTLFRPAPRAAIFDFDLTLADSTRAAGACIDHALIELGFEPVGSDRARRTIGLSLERTFQSLTGVSDPVIQARFRTLFLDHADLVMVPQTDLLEGVPELLDTLRAARIKLGVVSTKFRFRVQAILEKDGLADRFEVIVGGEDVKAHKPDPEGLVRALDVLATRAEEAVFLGDHIVDAEAAMRAGIPFLAVLSGESAGQVFSGYPNVGVLGTVAELPAFISSCEAWPPPGAVTGSPSQTS
jgi:phosphoglycolate phosphatase